MKAGFPLPWFHFRRFQMSGIFCRWNAGGIAYDGYSGIAACLGRSD
jgi:hypothetical protein